MKSTPAVSIIIAAYQARDFIVDAVTSALAQSVAEVEILVSPDEPPSVTDYSFLTALDPRMRVLSGVPQATGPGPARNRALGVARGEFIAVLDTDDLWSPEYLARLLPTARERGAAFGLTRITDWHGRVVREIKARGDDVGFADFATAYGSLHGLARREEGRRWQDVLAEDVLFDLETLALCDGKAPFMAEAVYQLRQRPHSVTRGDDFIRDIGAGYDRLIAMIDAGETRIAPVHVPAAITVFRSWQQMNRSFEQRDPTDRRDFQTFVAAYELPKTG